jgi:hypothetical protein
VRRLARAVNWHHDSSHRAKKNRRETSWPRLPLRDARRAGPPAAPSPPRCDAEEIEQPRLASPRPPRTSAESPSSSVGLAWPPHLGAPPVAALLARLPGASAVASSRFASRLLAVAALLDCCLIVASAATRVHCLDQFRRPRAHCYC